MRSSQMYLAMVLEGPGRLERPEASRTRIYISTKVAEDSAFPFKPGDRLVVRIDGKRLVVEKTRP